MEELNNQEFEQLLGSVPGGMAKLALDDTLTVLHFSGAFKALFKNISEKTSGKTSVSLLKLVYSADIISVTQQVASQKHRKDNMLDLHFRTVMQDGSTKWVLVSGKKTEETWQSGANTVPVYACIAMDASNFMQSYKKLEQTNDYRNKIAELSKDIYFEYEIATDKLVSSDLFRQVFGKENIITGFREKLEKTNIIHPDELPNVVSIYNSVMRGRKQVRFELRMAPKEGAFTWYLCYATIIFDENKNPFKVVGKIATTNHTAAKQEKSTYKPQLDSISGVCTAECAEYMITEALKEREADSLSAMFFIEIRNFNEINGIRKAINGENLMSGVGRLLNQHFRSTDIIGRFGIGEFVIYMKDISGDACVYELAEKLCKAIEALHSYSYMKRGMIVNIGIAIHKGVQEYPVLTANANTALIMAKKAPGSSFEVFANV